MPENQHNHDALDTMRHSAAHVMAKAVQRLYPGARLAIGPTIEHGFYYDIDVPETISEDDLPRIEDEMRRIVAAGEPFERIEMTRDDAIRHYREVEPNPLKVEVLEGIDDPKVSFYKTGPDWLDLCRGPHVRSTREIGAFKLTSVAGAYWRGDERNPMLQRIYGTAWPTEEELQEYLHRIEEAQRRDHRRLGRELDLYLTHELVGQGLPMLTPKGAVVRRLL
ncbi:MAG TPA: threonine--tRNA ligase, partial [Dehalococcoidia bacterium]|nr:threonine--tRNA ligase [Dehalococcoidia bacterium]